MEIFLEKENKNINVELEQKSSITNVLKKLDISVESVIILKNDEVTIEEDFVENKDKLKILSVVSGG